MSELNSSIRIAIIEKELITRLALSRCLRYNGMKVFYAQKLSEAAEENPDVIIVSHQVSADELHDAARKSNSKKGFPLLIIISWSAQPQINPALFPDFIFMRKPIVCSEITSVIRDALSVAIQR